MIAGTLEIQLMAGMARLQKDMDDAKRHVGGAMSSIDKAVGVAKSALMGLGAGLSATAFVAFAKSAINAADAMNDMSQQVGISVRDLAKYELAASQSGTTMASLAIGIKGLAGNLMEHGDALKAAGITATTADGAMQQLADVFAAMPDGLEKTTLAVKLFGKSGMEMIPMLNMGSEGLQTISEKSAVYAEQMAILAPLSDAFNDSLAEMSLQSKTVGMTLLNEVMPTLVKTADAMAQADAQGSTLAETFGKGIRTALEFVVLIASDVVFVFKGIGRELGAIAAQIVAALSGDWAGFSAIRDAVKADADAARTELDRFQADLVNHSAKVQTAYNKRQGFGEQIKSGTTGAALLAVFGPDAKATKAIKENTDAMKAAAAAAKANTDAVDDLFDAQEKLRMANETQIKTARTTLEQIQFETTLLEMNTEQRALATMERELERQGIVKGTQAYDAYIEKLREAMSIKAGKEVGIKAADDMRKAQQNAAEESGKYWEDALMRAFEAGKGFFESLWDTIKNTLKTQVLKISMQGVMGGLGIGASGAAMANNAGGSALGSLFGNAGSLTAMGAQFGSAASITMSNGLISGFGANMANIGGQLASGSFASALGMAMPYIGAAVLAYTLLTGNKTKSADESGRARIDYSAAGIGGDAYSTTGSAAQVANMTLATGGLAKSYFD
ncbi:MAG: hypothetical protein WC829_14725, partial [Hyphomicrobium sp.]